MAAARQRRRPTRLLLMLGLAALLALSSSTSFVPPRPRVRANQQALQFILSAGLAEAASSPADAAVNLEAYSAAAGVSPQEAREMLIDQTMTPAEAVGQAVIDVFFDTILPFSVGLGLVYGVALAIGAVENPFSKKDGANDAKK
eukprot:gb/GFBE01017568.1/.p1 GENE.gb/GFBE01017568.1/~~gb/GFBE01017568.1/.p1  ORF type:complete len:144 (+),score=38.49 gb/GFBE01017568.1/:1-432(+)